MSELKRCPFCGGEAKLRIDHYPRTVYSVECSNEDCFIGQLGVYRKKEEAIKVWNTRKPMHNIVERLEEERALLKEERKEAIEYDDEQIIFATNNQIRAFDYSLRVIREEGGTNEKVQ